MSKFNGLDTFFDVLSLLKDPTKFDEKLQQLQSESNRYQEVIESVVKLSDVNEYTVNIAKREEASKKALEDARTASDQIRESALKDADKTLQEAAKAVSEAQAVNASNKAAQKELKEKQKYLDSLIQDTENQKKMLQDSQDSLNVKLAEVEDRLAKLKSVMQ